MGFKGYSFLAGMLGCLLGTLAHAAGAEHIDAAEAAVSYPNITIGGSVELQYDSIAPTDDASGRVSAAFATIEPEVTLNLSEQFRLFAHLLYEPVVDDQHGASDWFRNEGFYAEELYAQATVGDVALRAGKVDPLFGLASDDAPGIYGTEFGSAYDYHGALGVGAEWDFSSREVGGPHGDPAVQNQSFTAYVFAADTTFLSRSLFVDRGQISLDDGGLGNTDSPQSFSVAYSIDTVDAEDNLAGPSAQLGIRRLAAGMDGGRDEWGFVASGEDIFAIGDDSSITALAELAYFTNEAGGKSDAIAATVGAELQQGDWFASLVGAGHKNQDRDTTDTMITADIGHQFEFEKTGAFRLDAAYAHTVTDDDTADTLGLRFHKDLDWSSAPQM